MNIYWFQKDLRTYDMPLLVEAMKSNQVIGVFNFDPSFFELNAHGFPKKDDAYLNHVYDALIELKESLNSLNIPLYVFKSTIKDAILQLKKSVDIDAIYTAFLLGFEEEASLSSLKDLGVNVITKPNHSLYAVKDLPFSVAFIPDVFTTFRKKVEETPYTLTKDTVLTKQPPLDALNIPFLSKEDLNIIHKTPYVESGMFKALAHVDNYFTKRYASSYKDTRNDMYTFESSTKFSPHLAIGTLSPQMIVRKLLAYEQHVEKNESTYWIYFELLWRDFFYFTHLKFKHKVFSKDGLYGFKHTTVNHSFIHAWKNGETGFPLIDANMKLLNETGYMSNRGRQNVASFFVLVLKQDWRIGAAYFESKLIDYDVSSNTLNWLYLAGLGNDPRESRMFNMIKQGETYDPKRSFVKRMLKTLEHLPDHIIYRVHTLREDERVLYNITQYPKPICVVGGRA